jgi:hypothetical protein
MEKPENFTGYSFMSEDESLAKKAEDYSQAGVGWVRIG